jgi:Spy/CpxP family protein refolding chaperone
MKAFRIAALGVALLAGSSAIAGAQAAGAAAPTQGGPGGGRGGFNRTMAGIELTDAQKAKLAEINAKYAPEQQALRESFQNGGDRAEGMKKMQALREKMGP